MKKILLILCCFLNQFVFAQYQMDMVTRESPDCAVYQKVGMTGIDITYGSPQVKGRTIWGDLVPYDKIWRAGANWATTIAFSKDVVINNQAIQRDTYALFVIPRKSQRWTIILNAAHRQWGAYRYDESKDIARIDVIPQAIPKVEKLTYEIDNYGSQIALIQLKWEEVLLQLPIDVDYIQPLEEMLNIKSKTLPNHSKWIAYLQAAELLLQENQSLETALNWINESEKLSTLEMEWNKQFYPKNYIVGHLYWTKAKILAGLNQPKEALLYGDKVMAIKGEKSFYQLDREKEKIDEKMAEWKK